VIRVRARAPLPPIALAGVVVTLGTLMAATLPRAARAYDFTIDLRTIGQGYQVRRFAVTGANELLTRRRLTQYLNLSVFNIEPDRWHGDGAEAPRNTLYFDASLRFDSDFGGYTLGRPMGSDEIHEIGQSQIDVLYAYLGGRNVGGRVDFQLGRQIHFDLVDFYAFDGADVLARLTRRLAAEAFAGTEVRGELPLSAPLYELDGTSAGSRDPATRPDQASALRPLAGAALVIGQDVSSPSAAATSWLSARVAYRRIWSATADRLPGEPASGVNDEKVALTASAALGKRVFITGGVRYNLLLGMLDDEQLAVRVKLPGRQVLTAEHAFLAPTFDGDSIWNVFSTGAYRDLRGGYEVGVTEDVKLYARGFVRLFEQTPDETTADGRDLGAEAPGGRTARGASTGAVWRRPAGVLRADGYFDDGAGGRKTGLDLSARAAVAPRRLELETRFTGYRWRSDQQSATDAGFVLGVQAGARWEAGSGVRLHVLAEDNVGTFYDSQYRALAIVEIDAAL
jgi:hypothetical protein